MISASGVNVLPGGTNSPTASDIAIAMCRVTRYAGAIWCPLSVHSILVADLCWMASREDVDWSMGLLHDAHETVTGEVTRHWKPPEMKLREFDLDRRIFEHFHLDLTLYHRRREFVKAADEKALTAEALLLGLRNWPDYYEANEKRPPPTLGSEERTIATSLFRSSWMNPGGILAGSAQSIALGDALNLVRAGKHRLARERAGSR